MTKELTNQVFLSHTSTHRDLADAVAKILSNKGIRVWDAESIPAGSNLSKAIEKALEQSDSMIAILNPHSFSSSWVRKELEYALFDDRYKHRLLPVLLGDKSEDFARLPWVLSRLQFLRIEEAGSTPRRAKKITDAFIKLLLKNSLRRK